MPRTPLPADKAVGVTATPLIQWTAGATALWHDFYFGTDPNPPLVGRQMHTVYFHIPGLEAGQDLLLEGRRDRGRWRDHA